MYMRIIDVRLTFLCSVGAIKGCIFSYVTVSNHTNAFFRQSHRGLKTSIIKFIFFLMIILIYDTHILNK